VASLILTGWQNSAVKSGMSVDGSVGLVGSTGGLVGSTGVASTHSHMLRAEQDLESCIGLHGSADPVAVVTLEASVLSTGVAPAAVTDVAPAAAMVDLLNWQYPDGLTGVFGSVPGLVGSTGRVDGF